MDNDKLIELLRSFKREQVRLKRYIAISWMALLVVGIALIAWIMRTITELRSITVANTKAMHQVQQMEPVDGKDGKDGLSIEGPRGIQGAQGLPGVQGAPGSLVQAPAAQTVVGPQGIQGVKGDKGDQGEPGEPGRTPQFAQDANGKVMVRLDADSLWQPLPTVTVTIP